MYLDYLLFFLFVLPVFGAKSGSFSSMTCDKAKHPKMLRSCCNIPRDDKITKLCRKSLVSQKTNTSNNESRNFKSDKVALHACIAECVFKKNSYLLPNGTLNILVMQRSLEQRFKKDAVLSHLMVKSLKNCVEYAQRRTQQFEWMHIKDECDYYPATLLACTMEQVYKNCPPNKWKNSDDCLAMRKYLADCDDVKDSKI